jgi:formylglycine-generating enzyme required for sulfatase activity
VAVAVSLSGRSAQPLTRAEECALKPKDSFKECSTCPEMVVVPPGRFTMGSPRSEKGRYKDEEQHPVTFAQPFAVGKFAVTFDEWDACVSDGGCGGHRPGDQGWGRGRRPVINVSWHDAQKYAEWLSRKTGSTYRLLSEAEREYVTRAGTTTPFWWGLSISTRQANYDGSSYGGGPRGPKRGRTEPVDSFAANPWGLHQVHGNLDEWTMDCWNDNYEGAPSDGSAWTSGNCYDRVLRGGNWDAEPKFLRSAMRDRNTADIRGEYAGFRIARTLPP